MKLYIIGKEFDDFHTPERLEKLNEGLFMDQSFLIFSGDNEKIIAYCSIDILVNTYTIPRDNIIDGNNIKKDLGRLGNLKSYKQINIVGLELSDEQKQLIELLVNNVDKVSSTNWKIFENDESIRNLIKTNITSAGFANVQAFSLQRIISILNSDKEKKRFKRNQDFNKFFDSATEIFIKFIETDDRAKFFDERYMLSICPGSRWGMNNASVVEVFWGNRTIENELVSKKGFRMISESGSTLYIIKKLSGKVDIYLLPCRASNEDLNSKEGIIYKSNVEPSELLKKSFTEDLWKAFMAFTENTSIDGEPNLIQKVKYYYYIICKKRILNGIGKPRKILKASFWLLNFVLSIGLSGFIITMINNCSNDSITKEDVENVHKQLYEENENIGKATKVLDEIRKDNQQIKNKQNNNIKNSKNE